jgi:hypothetical protein
MRELAEQENARERAGLLQERAQIARLREALRHEKAKGQETSKKSGS